MSGYDGRKPEPPYETPIDAKGISQETAHELLDACKLVMRLLENGTLVRDISKDAAPNWSLTMLDFVAHLQAIQRAIVKADDELAA